MRRRTIRGAISHDRSMLAALLLVALLILAGCSSGGSSDDSGTAEESTVQMPPPEPRSEPIVSGDDARQATEDESTATLEEPAQETPVVEAPAELIEEETPTLEDVGESEVETPEQDEPSGVIEGDTTPVPDESAETDSGEADSGELQAFSVADTKPGLTRVGAEKCKLCHKIQYASWADSKHAQRSPALECESCHGSGSEYKKKSIMQDPALARAAGLVIPDATFCQNCHHDDWNDEMLHRAHAHKEDAGG